MSRDEHVGDDRIDTVYLRLHGAEPPETVGMVVRLPSGAEWWVQDGRRPRAYGREPTHMEASERAEALLAEAMGLERVPLASAVIRGGDGLHLAVVIVERP